MTFSSSSIRACLFCSRPAVSMSNTSQFFSRACVRASKASPAASAPTLRAITSANGIENPNRVREGTKLSIPDKASAQVASAKPISAATVRKVHVVAKGETLGVIARRYKVTVDEIKKLNDITNERRVRDGRELTLPDSAEGAATAGSAAGQAKAERPQPVCPVQNAGKFKARYTTLGFQDVAALDSGSMWPTSFAVTRLTKAGEKEVADLVRRAVG